MKKKIVFSFGTLFGLFLVGSIIEWRGSRANGAYSTPVTVMNTTAAPAITLGAELVARTPFESTLTQVCTPGPGNCQFLFLGNMGPGHRTVIENVSGQISLAPGTTSLPSITFDMANNNPNGGAIGNHWGIPPGPIVTTQLNALEVMFNQHVVAYVDGGGSAGLTIFTNHTASSAVTLSGYIEDCSLVPCPAIQH